MLPTAKYRHLIYTMSEGLPTWQQLYYPPEVWLEALIMQESSGNERAYRKEPSGAESFGLMQLLTPTVRSILQNQEFTSFNFLYDPFINLSVGRLVVFNLLEWVGRPDVPTILARYNGGGIGNPGEDGTLRNQGYVNSVGKWCIEVIKDSR